MYFKYYFMHKNYYLACLLAAVIKDNSLLHSKKTLKFALHSGI